MTYLKRFLIFPVLAAGIQLAQAAPEPEGHEGTFLDHIEMISTYWWVTTLVATFLLGILVGFFIYRGAVSNGRAGGATGAGCLVAVIVFLVCQTIAVIMLAFTIFNLPVSVPLKEKEKPKVSADSPPATPQPVKPNTPAKNNGDDF